MHTYTIYKMSPYSRPYFKHSVRQSSATSSFLTRRFVRWTSTWIVICVQNTAGSECCQFACIAPCQVAQLEGKPNAASNWFTMYYIYIFCLFTKLVAWPWVVKGWWLSLSDNSDISFFKQKFQKFSHSTLPLKLTAPPWKWVLGRLGSFLAGLAYLHRKNIYKHNWLEPVFQLTTGKPKIGGFGSMFFSTFPRGVQHRREFCGLLFSRMLGFAWPRCVEKVLSIDIYLKK